MLRLLVDFLSGVIRVLAALCIVGGAVAGYLQSPTLQVEPWAGALIGFAAGFLTASVGAGLLACLILIENHLRVLADAQIALQKQESTRPQSTAETVDEAALARAERAATYAQSHRNAGYDPSRGRIPSSRPAASGPDSKPN